MLIYHICQSALANDTNISTTLTGLIVFLEHRYYGESKIFLSNSTSKLDLQYLTVENALQDTAAFLTHFKRERGCNNKCKTFVFGGSYGGMLVGWFRLKYPHMSTGGVVSSGSIDYYDIDTIPEQTWSNALSAWQYEGGEECLQAITSSVELLQHFDRCCTRSLIGWGGMHGSNSICVV